MSPIFRGDLLMMVTTTFRHKTQDSKLKSYVNKIVENLSFYTDLINCIQVTFETDSLEKAMLNMVATYHYTYLVKKI